MEMRPRISVLLPVWNAEKTLAATLQSIRRQTERRFECIVVDDGSRDESPEIVRALAHRDPRFVLHQRAHEGLVASLNAGVDLCRGEIVARMDADDWMHRERLALQADALDAEPSLWAVGTHVRIFPRRSLRDGHLAYERWLNSLSEAQDIRRDRFIECPIAHPTLAIRRSVLARARYRDRGWPEDHDLLLRLLDDGPRVGVVPRRLLGWRDHPDRLSRTDGRYGLDRFTDCRAFHLSRSFLGGAEEYVLWGHGSTGRALRRALDAHGHRPRFIVEVHPRRIGQRIHGAEVIPPQALRKRRSWPIVVSVAGSVPRGQIRSAMAEMGYREGEDFVCAA